MQIAAGRTVSEVGVDEFLTGQRRAQAGFIEPSFPTIAGMGFSHDFVSIATYGFAFLLIVFAMCVSIFILPNSEVVNIDHV